MFSRIFERLAQRASATAAPQPMFGRDEKGRSSVPHVPPSRVPVQGPDMVILKKNWPWTSQMAGARSHFGGLPMLPEHVEWPRCFSLTDIENDQPMHFLAQIDCAELPDFSGRKLLPGDGVLFFFCLIDEDFGADPSAFPPAWEVIYVPAGEIDDQRHLLPRDTRPIAARSPCLDQTKQHDRRATAYEAEDNRFGFVPVSPVVAPSLPDPSSDKALMRDDEARWAHAAKLDEIYKTALGERKAEYARERTDFDVETVLQAREVLHRLRIHAETSLKLDLAHPERAHAAERTQAARATIELCDKAFNEMSGLSPLDQTPAFARRFAIETASRKMQESGSPHLDIVAVDAAMRLLREHPVDALPLRDGTRDALVRRTQGRNDNENVLLGFPSEAQKRSADSARECGIRLGYYDALTDEADLVLLLQLDTCFGAADFLFCDCGKVYFFIHKDDLIARRFDRVVMAAAGG